MQDVFSLTNLEKQEKSLPEEISSHILTKIFTGHIMQGTRLIESDIAKELNVSSIPVREAFYILQSSGVVERTPRKGVRVKQFTEEEINDCIDASMELYKLALEYSQGKWNEESHRILKQYLDATTENLTKKNVVEYLKTSEKLLKFIFEIAGNKAFIRFFTEMINITTAYCQTRWRNFEKIEIWHGYLENAVDSIVRSDFAQAEKEFEALTQYALKI